MATRGKSWFPSLRPVSLRQPPGQHKAGAGANDVFTATLSTLGAGQALDAATRARMEPAFGQDFSHVRVHHDTAAAQAAQTVGAQAFTVGRDMVFGAGQYAPQAPSGAKLLAHELTHVAQPQRSGAAMLSQPGDASEREADQAAETVTHGGSVRPVAEGATLQRQPLPGSSMELPPLSGVSLLDKASPLLAAAKGSATLESFDTGKAELKPEHQRQLDAVSRNIQELLREYTLSTLSVTGYADTVDTQPKNLALGTARAAAVKQALVERGLPEAMIVTDTKGEGAPQAVRTKDETPNAKNRRVEVRFHPKKSGLAPLLSPKLTLTAPGKQGESDPPDKPPINLFPPQLPNIFDDGPQPPFRPKQPDFFKPIPPAPKGSQPSSALDVIGKKVIDPVVDAVAGFLPKEARDKIKDAARSGVKAGIAKGARAAAEALGLKDPQALDAIEKATEAAIQEKGQARP